MDKTPEITNNLIVYDVKAPVAENSVVGQIEIFKDGVLIDSVNLVAAESVERASFADYFKRTAEEWAI